MRGLAFALCACLWVAAARNLAAQQQGEIDDLIKQVAAAPADKTPWPAMKQLAAFGAKAVGPVAARLNDPDARIRQRMVQVLGETRAAEAMSLLTLSLDDPQREVVQAAQAGLMPQGKAALSAILERYQDPDRVLREALDEVFLRGLAEPYTKDAPPAPVLPADAMEATVNAGLVIGPKGEISPPYVIRASVTPGEKEAEYVFTINDIVIEKYAWAVARAPAMRQEASRKVKEMAVRLTRGGFYIFGAGQGLRASGDSAAMYREVVKMGRAGQADDFKRACWLMALPWFRWNERNLPLAAAVALDFPPDTERVDALARRMEKEMPLFEFRVGPERVGLSARNVSLEYCLQKFSRQFGMKVSAAPGLRAMPGAVSVEGANAAYPFLQMFADRVGGRLVKAGDAFAIEPLAPVKDPRPPAPWTLVWKSSGSWAWPRTPVVADGKALMLMEPTGLSALDLRDGSQAWKAPLPHMLEDLLVADGVAYVGGGDNDMQAIWLKNGEELWNHQAPITWLHNARPNYSVRVLGIQKGLVYFASMDGNMYALDPATGEEAWKTLAPCHAEPPPGNSHRAGWFGTLAGDTLYAVGGGSLAAMDLVQRKLLWRKPAPADIAGRVMFHEDRLILAGKGIVSAWSVADGHLLWQRDTGRKGRMDGPRLIIEGRLIVPGSFDDNYLYCLNPGTGELLWETNLPQSAHNVAPFGKGRVALCLSGGDLGIVDMASGALMEMRPMGVTLFGAPVIAGDLILVPSHDETGKAPVGVLSAWRPVTVNAP